MRKIFDGFTFMQEFDLLKIRCEEMKDLNVTHILVEGRYTFTGKEKPLYFQERKEEFKEYNIRHIILEEKSVSTSPWDQEALQRNTILRGLKDANDEDIVIISDVDEIPKKEAIESYKPEMGLTGLAMNMYYYWLNCSQSEQQWKPAKILPYHFAKTKTPNEIRNGGHTSELSFAGWHFSWLGDGEFALNKMQSFSHQELNIPGLTKDTFQYKIDNCEDFCTHEKFKIVAIDNTFPSYLQNNIIDFKHLIKEI